MQFELSTLLLDEILFAMEDQEGSYYLDTREGCVVSEEEREEAGEESGRFIDIPEWDSSDGYRLMERFALECKNSLVQKELSTALDRGRGVFRAFKDVLSRHLDMEKLWYDFKDREMKHEAIEWYNGLRETWGLERIGSEPEETEDLVLEDFAFRNYRDEDNGMVYNLHYICQEELRAQGSPTGGRKGFSKETLQGTLVAETAKGAFAGFCAPRMEEGALVVQALEVRPEYRGLGVGKALLGKVLEKARAEGVHTLVFDLPGGVEFFSRVLLREGFSPFLQRYKRDMR